MPKAPCAGHDVPGLAEDRCRTHWAWGDAAVVPHKIQGGKCTSLGQVQAKQKAWHLMQWYRSWPGTEISLSAKNLV